MDYKITYNFKGNDITINIKRRIPFYDVEEIVNTIVDGVLEDGKYYPSRYDYYYFYMILAKYTDLDLEQFNADEICELSEGPVGLYEQIVEYISSVQLQTILSSADKLINAKLNEHPLKKICEDLNSLIGSFEKFVDNLNDNPAIVSEVIDSLDKVDKDKIVKLKSILENK